MDVLQETSFSHPEDLGTVSVSWKETCLKCMITEGL